MRTLPRKQYQHEKPRSEAYPATSLTLIGQACRQDAEGRAALGKLIERYQRAIRLAALRGGSIAAMTSDDVCQELRLHLAMPTEDGQCRLAKYDPLKDRFRCWLTRTLNNRVSNVRRKTMARRRGDQHTYAAGDDLPDISACPEFPTAAPRDIEDDVAIAEALSFCRLAVERLRSREPHERFRELERFLPGNSQGEDRSYTQAQLNMTANTLTKTITRIRARFMIELTKVIADKRGSSIADPGLDPGIRKERERVLELLASHPWSPQKNPR